MKNGFSFSHPAIDAVAAFVRDRGRRARDRGASAVEWVIISAVVVAIVGVVAAVIGGALDGGAKKVSDCIAGANQSGTCAGGGGGKP